MPTGNLTEVFTVKNIIIYLQGIKETYLSGAKTKALANLGLAK